MRGQEITPDYLRVEHDSAVERLLAVQRYSRVVLVIMYEVVLLLRGHAEPSCIRLCSSSLAAINNKRLVSVYLYVETNSLCCNARFISRNRAYRDYVFPLLSLNKASKRAKRSREARKHSIKYILVERYKCFDISRNFLEC